MANRVHAMVETAVPFNEMVEIEATVENNAGIIDKDKIPNRSSEILDSVLVQMVEVGSTDLNDADAVLAWSAEPKKLGTVVAVALVVVVEDEENEKAEIVYDFVKHKMDKANHYVVVVPKQPDEKIPDASLPYVEVDNAA